MLLNIEGSVFCKQVASRIVLQVEAPGPQENDTITYARDLGSNLQTEFSTSFLPLPPPILFRLSFSPSWLPILIDISSGGRHLVFPPAI